MAASLHSRVLREAPSLPTSIFVLVSLFPFHFDITQLASLLISTVYFFPLNHVLHENLKLLWSRQDLTTELVM